MSKTTRNYEPYVYALREQVAQHVSGLEELSEIQVQRPLTFNERNAAERSIQVLVESAIGASKQLLKMKGKPVPSDARASVERVYEILAITQVSIEDMYGAIGMRNAIIHDYLNLDWEKISPILAKKKYELVARYAHEATGALLAG